MSATSTIEWTDATWNPVTGCTEVSPGCDHCLDPETLVLYGDFTWRRLGDVQVGDILIGFDENEPTEGRERKLKKTVVQAVLKTHQPAMKVTTNHAEVICSGEHRFLAHGFSRWLYAKHFSLGTQLRTIGCFSAQVDNDRYAAGYLMGMTDGDGTWRFTPGQRSDKKGFPQCYWRVALTDEETFLGTSLDAQPAIITKLEMLGERELIDIETTTHTFFANGLAAHNCYAKTFAERFRGVPNHPYEQGFDLKLWPERLELPLQWKKPRRIFVNSMSDLFHKDIPDDYIRRVFDIMLKADWHIFQVLTKSLSE